MPLPGGAADKLGNRYEIQWTVRCLAEILSEEATSIWLEPPGSEGDGAEFILQRKGVAEYHQVKRQHSGSGRWSLSALEGERILSRFWTKLRNSDSHCVFVSMYAADELFELAERARSSRDAEEFRQFFRSAKDQEDHFQKLRACWQNCSEEQAYLALKRITVRISDELTLREEVNYRLTTLIDAPPATASALLSQLTLNNVHQTLTTHDVWQFLEIEGLKRRSWNNDPHILTAVATSNARYLDPLRQNAVLGTLLPRAETEMALARLMESPGHNVLLSGGAGTGKSGVALQVTEAVRALGWPVIAFRIDRFETMSTSRDVGKQLELPDSPVTVLANIAQGRECLLLIDQLDAVSKASGRNPLFFDCVEEIIRQAKIHPAMRLVLLCRRFDIDNDDRLRRLIGTRGVAEEIPVKNLSHEAVRAVVQQLGLDPQRLDERRLELLSLPLHLKLLSEIADSSRIDPLNFTTARDLLSYFWDSKQDILAARLGRPVNWTGVVDLLVDDMNRHQALSAAKDVVAAHRQDAQAMASERVLLADGSRFAFFHETFFDYAFARRFVARGGDLLQMLTESEQHLFRRAQVRQILLHLREEDWESYLESVRGLLTRSDIRFHIKQVVFSVLAIISSPTSEEWNLIAPLLDAADQSFVNEAWRVLNTQPWFFLLDQLGVVRSWLTSPDQMLVDRGIMYLSRLGRELPDKIAHIIAPFAGTTEAWNQRLVSVLASSSTDESQPCIDLLLRLIDDGTLDGMEFPFSSRGGMALALHSLPEKQPAWASEVIGHYLLRCLHCSREHGQPNPFASEGGTILDADPNDDLMSTARGAPVVFVRNVLPFMLQVIEATADRNDKAPYPDAVWPYRFYGTPHGFKDGLHSAMEEALRRMAAEQPDDFRERAELLRRSDCFTAQFLLIRSYQANGKHFADEAAEYLCARPERLHTGYMDEGYWAARLLLEAITPHCSESKLCELEQVVMSYYSHYETSALSYHKGGGTQFGRAQLTLLNGFDPKRRSADLTRRLLEWRRKFGIQDNAAPQGVHMVEFHSPVPAVAAEKLTDAQWLSALLHYQHEHHSSHDFSTRGSGHELSWMLQRATTENPSRFAALVQRLPDEVPAFYFDAILRGLAATPENGRADTLSPESVETILAVCRRCHSLPGRLCGRWILSPIRRIGKQALPDDILEMVIWYAVEDSDPDTPSVNEYGHAPERLSIIGLNSVRGGAAAVMADLMFDDPSRTAVFATAIDRMVDDPSAAVRSWVAEVLTAMLNTNRDRAVAFFIRLCETDDAMLAAPSVQRFLYHASYTHYQQLKPLLERMLNASHQKVVSVGTVVCCQRALVSDEGLALAQTCIQGAEAQRLAAAEILAINLPTAPNSSFCEQALLTLAQDEVEAVREKVSTCFWRFQDEQLGEHIDFVNSYVNTKAFSASNRTLLHAFKTTTDRLPDVVCSVCERWLQVTGSEASDLRTLASAEAQDVSDLIVRVYVQSKDASVQRRCLDVIDALARLSLYGLSQALLAFDRE